MLRKISTWFDEQKRQSAAYAFGNSDQYYQQQAPFSRHCSQPNCQHEGLYKAPKMDGTSTHQNDLSWLWFCEQHVRDYNARWNYYKGMNEDQAYASYRGDVTWNRPTWPMGKWSQQQATYQKSAYHSAPNFSDPLGVFHANTMQAPRTPRFSKQDHEAMRLMGLNYPFTQQQLQFAYRQSVKRYHPDLNGGDPKSEEIFKKITEGYTSLKKWL
jgi:DnaJ domain